MGKSAPKRNQAIRAFTLMACNLAD